jgi:hypothetical protein
LQFCNATSYIVARFSESFLLKFLKTFVCQGWKIYPAFGNWYRKLIRPESNKFCFTYIHVQCNSYGTVIICWCNYNFNFLTQPDRMWISCLFLNQILLYIIILVFVIYSFRSQESMYDPTPIWTVIVCKPRKSNDLSDLCRNARWVYYVLEVSLFTCMLYWVNILFFLFCFWCTIVSGILMFLYTVYKDYVTLYDSGCRETETVWSRGHHSSSKKRGIWTEASPTTNMNVQNNATENTV